MEFWILVAALAFAAWGIVGGIAFLRGHLRRMARWYLTPNAPAVARNLGFVQLPFGLSWAFGLAMVGLADSDHPIIVLLAAALGLLSLGIGILGIVWLFAPPRWMRPAWLVREEEIAARGAASGIQHVRRDDRAGN